MSFAGVIRTRLYDYQQTGVRFLRVAESALLADEMGTGKTVQAITTLEEEKLYPALIVCPNSVKSVWSREFAKWAPDREVKVAGSGTATATRAVEEVANGFGDVLVVNWEALRALSRLAPFGSVRLRTCKNCDPSSTRAPHLCEREDKVLNGVAWRAVIADEAHRAKNPKAAQTRALKAIRSERRFALTGSPVANDAGDLWSIMNFVSPEEYPDKWPFLNRYAVLVPNFFSGGSDIAGLREDRREELDRFFLPRFLRRTKAEVLSQLPPKVYERRDVFLSGKQKKAYDQMAAEMVAAVEGGTLVGANVLTAALRLRQLASAYGTVIGEDVRLAEPSSKLDEMEDVLNELGDRQVVIFAESAQLIKLAHTRLRDKLLDAAMIIGDTPVDKRTRLVEQFQSGELRYLLATVGAGGEGITLTAADVAIYLQRPWSAVLNSQSEDRLHRIGQEANSVTYIDLVAKDTIEERVFEALERKERALQDVVRDELRLTEE